jgi:hypothetical protein
MEYFCRHRTTVVSALAISCALLSPAALAHRPLEPGGHYGPILPPYEGAPTTVSGTWTSLMVPFPGRFPDTALLLTDGTVIMHQGCSPNWYRLTPDRRGSYIGGRWHQAAQLPAGYEPLDFASSVLTDGRVIINGGEYNGEGCQAANWTTLGALYDPVINKWTPVPAPAGWEYIGDASSVVLQDGTYMLQDSRSSKQALATIAGTSVTWSATGTGKADDNDEEGWSLLRDGTVLTVDATLGIGTPSPAELYSPSTGTWSATATAPIILVDPAAHEIGPAILLPGGKVFQVGGNSCGRPGCPGHTALYSSGTWTAGPDLPAISGRYYDVDDGPASILPDGNVLVEASPSYACPNSHGKSSPFCSPSHFFEFNGTAFVRVNEPADAPVITSFAGRMLALPTGQILWSTYRGSVELYTPRGQPNTAWLPTIASVPTTLVRGTANYSVAGTQLQGVSNGAAYGDDAQMNTNYPLIRIINIATGNVCFARTHDYTATQTSFDMPAASPSVWTRPCDTGSGWLQIVVNGLASLAVTVTVQ